MVKEHSLKIFTGTQCAERIVRELLGHRMLKEYSLGKFIGAYYAERIVW